MKRILHWIKGTRIVAAWIAAGAPMVSQQLAEERSSVCMQCPQNKPSKSLGFLGTLVIATVNLRSLMRTKNRLRSGLAVCAVCECPLPHKVTMPIDEIAKGIALDKGELLLFPDKCWIRKELVNE